MTHNTYYPHNHLLPFYTRWQITPENTNYNLSFYYQLTTHDETKLLIKSVETVIRLMPNLRQTFSINDKQLIATIHPELPANISYFNTSSENIEELLNKLACVPHDLNKSLIHLNIIKCNDYFVTLFNIHHIIMDGSGLDQFIDNLNKLINKKNVSLIKPEEYIKLAKNESLKINDVLKKSNDYLTHLNHTLQSCAYKKPNNSSCLHYKKLIDKNLYDTLTKFSKSQSISLFNLLLIANNIFISKLFNHENSIINYPVNIRTNKKLDGCFVKLIPFFLKKTSKDTFLSLISSFKTDLEFYKQLSKTNDTYPNELYECPSFAESSIAKPLPLLFDNKSYSSSPFPQIAESILSIKYRVLDNTIYFTCDVLVELFPEYLSETILDRYLNLLTCLIENNTKKTTGLSLLSPQEEINLINSINKNYRAYPKHKSVCQIIEEYSAINPDSIALIYDDQRLTYSELNKKANQIANFLIEKQKLRPNDFIALFFSRNMSVIIAMLAVLKTGAAYVSLSKNSPDDRIKHVIDDTKTKLILGESNLLLRTHKIFETYNEIEYIALDEPYDFLKNISTENLSIQIKPESLAHIIYTSGTTGLPKGVMIDHKNILSLVINTSYFTANELDTFALFADLTFDAATFEIWGALLNGAKLFIPRDRLEIFANTVKFKEMISINNVTILLLTKTIFDQLYYADETLFSALNYLLIGGEALNKSIIDKLSASQHKPTHLINAYGPTENTTISTSYEISYDYLKKQKTVPIGTAISNRAAYVLDINLNPLPIGVVGELFVGGDGLSSGYLNQKKLSKEKFISNPLYKYNKKLITKNQKLYKTGDLAKILDKEGHIEFIGRNDFQIKIRGYRIESSEIENQLMTYPKIVHAIVLTSNQISAKTEEIYLIAYYKSVNNSAINEDLLEGHLRKVLPDYMIPSVFVLLADIPKTPTGKLDIKALPAPKRSQLIHIEKPINLKQQIICDAYSKVLGIQEIGINSDFFKLGGNSILAIELTAILHHNFNIHVADIFKLKTPKKISDNTHLLHNNIEKNLNKIKDDFIHTNKQAHLYRNLNDKISKYFSSIYGKNPSFLSKSIQNILLTGSTGYLGCNILRQLLVHTDYNLFLLIRSDSTEKAFHTLNRKFKFYFDEDLHLFHNRLFVIKSDIEKNLLGISPNAYGELKNNIDSIIHCAALTKHYGNYNEFYSANVQATINLLELSKETKQKDFHFISTISTLDNSYSSCEDISFFTEDDFIETLDNQPNFYIKTKHEAEKLVIAYRKTGVSSNIYRVGNLAFISENFRVQENIEDNAFFSRMKCLLTLKIATQEIGLEEISPVDLTALAIVKIMDKKELSDQIFHVFNPNLCDVVQLLSKTNDINVMTINDFLDYLAGYLHKPNMHHSMIMRFLLHQNWLDGANNIHIINFVLQSRTNKILEMLDFKWPIITELDFSEFIKHAYQS
ncbi:MAG: hypothetical protein CK424_06765 [Legionella sp.]|nr:MAG: hypothetical protein CK424_06765 [Legionella sp.]